MHDAALEYVRRVVTDGATPRLVLEVGARDTNGSARVLFDGQTDYLGIDLMPGPAVDLVADGVTYEPPTPPDLILCLEVLEHAVSREALLANLARVLRPGGRLVVTCAGPGRAPHSGFDGGALRGDEFYENVEPEWLIAVLEAMGLHPIVSMSAGRQDVYATAIKPWAPLPFRSQETAIA